MKKVLILFAFLTIIKVNSLIAQDTHALIEADSLFSLASERYGYQKAFLQWADKEMVIIRDNAYPILGSEQLSKIYKEKPDSNYLVWQPTYAKIAQSGELGYTYGFWQYTIKAGEKAGQIMEGCYVTVWLKQPDGSWKFIFDTGTDGLGKE